MQKNRLAWRLALLALLHTGIASAQQAMPVAAGARPPSLPLPQQVAICSACHGAGGNSQISNIPSLAGQPKVFLEQQLIVIREGLRVIPEMAGVVNGLSDKDITALAQHFASQSPVATPGPKNAAQFERGSVLAAKMHCASCHLANYQGREQMPRLAGQREDYLVYTMRQFRDGKAIGRDTIMAGALYGVSDQDIGDLAHHMAQLP